ncbi:MAG: cadherin-like beta sandwich domain-containing protein [Clostridia bacterium]|nr:cadherin-like beta sandwich domain-containing protein [Clostridia bacterium]
MKLKTKIKLILLVFTIVYMILGSNIVNAAGYDISATSYDVKVGENVTIDVSFTGATWNIEVSGNGITEAVYVGYTEDLSEKTTSKSINLDTSKEGTYTITMTGTVTDENGTTTKVDKTITVKVSKIETPTQPETPTTPTTPPATVTKSSEARLSNLGIKPNDFKGFKKDTYKYTTEVPNDVSEVEIYADVIKGSNAKVEGVGKVQLKEGNNEFSIKVTAEDGTTTKTYKLTIKRRTAAEEEAANGEARLSSLGIKPEKYDFEGFNKDTTEYSVQIPENINEIEVYATAVDSKAQITGTGIITLEEGESTLEIVVIAVNGTKKTYSINVIRTEAEATEEPEQPVIEEKFGLSTLTVTGLTLNPKFDVETYEYTLDLKQDLTSLQIVAKANDENATVEIVGNENLQEGENVITILVKNEGTEEVATYQIIVNKTVVPEEIQMSWLKPSTWGKEEIIKIILIVVLIILIISAIILKINISKESKKTKKVDLPGADELDKAIAEHQELAEEEANSEEAVEKDEAKANYLEEIAKSRLNEENDSNFEVEEYDIKPRKKGKHF